MNIVTREHLFEAQKLYPDAAKELAAWCKTVANARWRDFLDVRQAFPNADAVDGYVVFNTRQNRYSLTTVLHYSRKKEDRLTEGHAYIWSFLTHKQYNDRANWSKEISDEHFSCKSVDMIRPGAPHLISSDKELAVYTVYHFKLTAKAKPSRYDEEAIALLTLLVDQYESQRYAIPDAQPEEVLRFLVDQHGLTQRDLSAELGSETTVSLVLSGKRQLTRNRLPVLAADSMLSHLSSFHGDEGLLICSAYPDKRY